MFLDAIESGALFTYCRNVDNICPSLRVWQNLFGLLHLVHVLSSFLILPSLVRSFLSTLSSFLSILSILPPYLPFCSSNTFLPSFLSAIQHFLAFFTFSLIIPWYLVSFLFPSFFLPTFLSIYLLTFFLLLISLHSFLPSNFSFNCSLVPFFGFLPFFLPFSNFP